MQFAVQACVQERAMTMVQALGGAVHGGHRVGGAQIGALRGVGGFGELRSGGLRFGSQFLAPGLAALRVVSRVREEGNGGREGALGVRAGEAPRVGAYEKDAFVNENEAQKIAHVAKRLERTAGQFKRLGSLGFWGQLVCTVVAAVILAFSVVITGQATSPASIYLTGAGIAAAFLSVFWSFGYIRLAQKLRDTIGNPTKAPPRAQVVKNLRNGIIINLLGMGATLLGLQATVGVLVAKALTSSGTPFLQGAPQGYSPVLALDVFLVQVSNIQSDHPSSHPFFFIPLWFSTVFFISGVSIL
ncbi:hypothetical protein M758_5G036000 [Ceratodon purpureus]|uniref:Uncharacterized protein n=1 Tax=Ceratodon purpureus TaxID=3225 RepID=A0A8T0HYM3_CERPU|nr:hypothetical protein KC19_5G036100 [Ceratodon purpureus]KAG0615373.1 hypothetical protein M758_5G036000 [Ceratodon purpureus]